MDVRVGHTPSRQDLASVLDESVGPTEIPGIGAGTVDDGVEQLLELAGIDPAGEQRDDRGLPAQHVNKMQTSRVAILEALELLEEHDRPALPIAGSDQRQHRRDAAARGDGRIVPSPAGVRVDGELTDRSHHIDLVACRQVVACKGREDAPRKVLDPYPEHPGVGIGTDRISASDVFSAYRRSERDMLAR